MYTLLMLKGKAIDGLQPGSMIDADETFGPQKTKLILLLGKKPYALDLKLITKKSRRKTSAAVPIPWDSVAVAKPCTTSTLEALIDPKGLFGGINRLPSKQLVVLGDVVKLPLGKGIVGYKPVFISSAMPQVNTAPKKQVGYAYVTTQTPVKETWVTPLMADSVLVTLPITTLNLTDQTITLCADIILEKPTAFVKAGSLFVIKPSVTDIIVQLEMLFKARHEIANNELARTRLATSFINHNYGAVTEIDVANFLLNNGL